MKRFVLIIFFFLDVLVYGETKNVLFIGNSYTDHDGYYLPQITADIANSAGDVLNFGSNAIGLYTLQLHSANSTTLSLIRQGGWDYVVLQEFSQYPSQPLEWVEENVFPYAGYLNNQINTYNSGALTMFYMTWGRKNGDGERCPSLPEVCTYEGMDDLTRERYLLMGQMYSAEVSPVGAVWRYLRTNYPSLELYVSDGSHYSEAGAYAAACCFYAAIFRKDPTLSTYNYTLSSGNAAIIRSAAKTVVYDNLSNWYIGKYDSGSPSDTEAPAPPAGLHSGNVTGTGFNLYWSASSDNVGITGYNVYRNGTLVSSVTATNSSISGLTNGTTYTMTVRAKDAAGNLSSPSSPLSVTTSDTQAPTTPSGLAASAITETGFTLTWSASDDNTGVSYYDIYRNGSWAYYSTHTSVTITGLTVATTYNMTVRAIDAAGNTSQASSVLPVTTADTHAPTIPSNLTAANITESGFVLSWSSSTDNVGVTGYYLYRNGTYVQTVTGTSATISGLSPSMTCTMTVRAFDAAGNRSTAGSLTVTTIDTHAPAVPTGLSAGSITETGFVLYWNASTDNVAVTEYDVYLDGALVSCVTGTQATISGLSASTHHNMTVRAKDAAGNISSASAVLSVTTADTHAPSAPSGLDADNITETGFTLSWTVSTDNVGVTGYEVYRNGNPDASTAGTSMIISGLTASTSYTMTVKARDAAGNVSASGTSLSVTTVDTHPPTLPAGLTAYDLEETEFSLRWTPSSDNVGVTGYEVYVDDKLKTTVASQTATITGLTICTSYSVSVTAFDAAGNKSDPGPAIRITTPDTHSPTAPEGLAASNVTKSGLILSWEPSTDNIGVTGYELYQNDILLSTVTKTATSRKPPVKDVF